MNSNSLGSLSNLENISKASGKRSRQVESNSTATFKKIKAIAPNPNYFMNEHGNTETGHISSFNANRTVAQRPITIIRDGNNPYTSNFEPIYGSGVPINGQKTIATNGTTVSYPIALPKTLFMQQKDLITSSQSTTSTAKPSSNPGTDSSPILGYLGDQNITIGELIQRNNAANDTATNGDQQSSAQILPNNYIHCTTSRPNNGEIPIYEPASFDHTSMLTFETQTTTPTGVVHRVLYHPYAPQNQILPQEYMYVGEPNRFGNEKESTAVTQTTDSIVNIGDGSNELLNDSAHYYSPQAFQLNMNASYPSDVDLNVLIKNSTMKEDKRFCLYPECTSLARARGFCIRHGGGKRCEAQNCNKAAEGNTKFCVQHGGGKRCQHPTCFKSAKKPSFFCINHGGGRRCEAANCDNGAKGQSRFCVSHGGGVRCAFEDCSKGACHPTNFCIKHGGGKRCKVPNCGKHVPGKKEFCKAHATLALQN